jgi:hypothetical protein
MPLPSDRLDYQETPASMQRAQIEHLQAQVAALQNQKPTPWVGIFAIISGIISLFFWGVIFAPVAFVMSFYAISRGEFVTGLFGMFLSIVGFITTPILMIIFFGVIGYLG